ncbi:MAG TPA: hypothetical protein VLT88_13550, partial [Desulfosarcina sp.]|nr:hypothetical protein [Desulfosarcina sp.]
TRVDATLGQTLAASLAGLALTHTIAKAVLAGLITRNRPFFRTPKMAGASALARALAASLEEILLGAALLGAAAAIGTMQPMETLDMNLWVIVLLVQSIPYVATLLVALISGFPRISARLVDWRRGRAPS